MQQTRQKERTEGKGKGQSSLFAVKFEVDPVDLSAKAATHREARTGSADCVEYVIGCEGVDSHLEECLEGKKKGRRTSELGGARETKSLSVLRARRGGSR